MFITNVVLYYYKAELCVVETSPVAHPQFSSSMRYDTYDRYDYELQKNNSLSDRLGIGLGIVTRYVLFIANVHWPFLQFVSDIYHRCPILRAYPLPLENRHYSLLGVCVYRGMADKNVLEIHEK